LGQLSSSSSTSATEDVSIKALPIKQNSLKGFSQLQEEQTSYAEEEEPADGLSQQ
jgi:hypothetical protein